MLKSVFFLSISISLAFSYSCNAQYNFFVGEDAGQLKTTINGFGSISFPSIMINQSIILDSPTRKLSPFFSVNFGFNWKQWRLADNSAVVRDDNGIIVVLPPPDREEYNDEFFGYTKSKLALGVIRIRPEFGYTTNNKKFSFGTGPLIEFALAAKHKRKFYDAGNKEIEKRTSLNYYNINKLQFGWGVSVGSYHFGAFSYLMLTPTFIEDLGPKVYAAEFGVYYRILNENLFKNNLREKKTSIY